MRLFIILIISLIYSSAFAQQQQQFIPYVVTQEDHTKILNYLGEQPAKIAIPLMQALNALEQKAIEEDKKKKDADK